MTFRRVREHLRESPGVLSMEEEGEAPTLLRVECSTTGNAELFALKFQLHPDLAGLNAELRGSTVVVSERD